MDFTLLQLVSGNGNKKEFEREISDIHILNIVNNMIILNAYKIRFSFYLVKKFNHINKKILI